MVQNKKNKKKIRWYTKLMNYMNRFNNPQLILISTLCIIEGILAMRIFPMGFKFLSLILCFIGGMGFGILIRRFFTKN